jgi:sigma-B regulation protein RsbU (phosphoserine phosphatase)
VLYTDGVPEARRGRDFYGEHRIRAILGSPLATSGAIASTLLADVLQFQGGTARDDIAIVVVGVPDER